MYKAILYAVQMRNLKNGGFRTATSLKIRKRY